MKKNSLLKVLTLLLVLTICLTVFSACKKDDEKNGNSSAENVTGVTNLDGTPIEVEPYIDESGVPATNEDGYAVYQVKNTTDENGNPVLVIKDSASAEEGFAYIIQIKNPDGTITNKTDESGTPVTTVFTGNPSDIPTATGSNNTTTAPQGQITTNQGGKDTQNTTNANQSATQVTQSPNQTNPRELPDSINLGGAFGIVTKDTSKGVNIYKGHIVESELQILANPVTYSEISATFTKGIYIPEKIGDYTVVQVAYVRLYTYYDEAFGSYDWYSERGIYKPNTPNNPLVYLGKNDTFDPGDDIGDIHSLFLIELA